MEIKHCKKPALKYAGRIKGIWNRATAYTQPFLKTKVIWHEGGGCCTALKTVLLSTAGPQQVFISVSNKLKMLKLPQMYRKAAVWFSLTLPVVINKYISENTIAPFALKWHFDYTPARADKFFYIS